MSLTTPEDIEMTETPEENTLSDTMASALDAETTDAQAEDQDEVTQHDDEDNEDEDQEDGQNEDRGGNPDAPDLVDIDQASMALMQQMLNDELDAANVAPPPVNIAQPQAANATAAAPQAAGDVPVPAIGDAQDDEDEDSDPDDANEEEGNQQEALDPNDPTAHFIDVNDADANDESTACPACDSVVQENELVYLTCGHVWCTDCLNNNLRAALSNRIRFPPRCCNATPDGIDMTVIQAYLEDDVLIRYLSVGEEYASSDPTFCANAKCGVFIKVPSDNTEQWASCTKCHTSTCVQCKGAFLAHPLPAMHPDLISKEDKELAEREGYKQCPNTKCRKLLERIDGCDHMTCICGTNFCYHCGRSLDHDSVDGMACNCRGQNQWVDGMQQWQDGGGDDEDGDGESDEGDEVEGGEGGEEGGAVREEVELGGAGGEGGRGGRGGGRGVRGGRGGWRGRGGGVA